MKRYWVWIERIKRSINNEKNHWTAIIALTSDNRQPRAWTKKIIKKTGYVVIKPPTIKRRAAQRINLENGAWL